MPEGAPGEHVLNLGRTTALGVKNPRALVACAAALGVSVFGDYVQVRYRDRNQYRNRTRDSRREPPRWEGPFTEYDRYGEPTGARYVRCTGCGVEVLAGDTEQATHRDGCDRVE